ncbi:hypothetical protein RB200_19785 [Streptomyces sp. PmtG]
MDLQNDSLVARTHQLARYQEMERNFWGNQRADESRAAVANRRIAELNEERDKLRARVAELESGLPVMQKALFRALDRVTELETERHATNQALADVTVAQRAAEGRSAASPSVQRSADRWTRFFAPTQALRDGEGADG